MKVTEKTKISELIKYNSQVIDAIASVNSHFKKLKNPILRKLLASRVTLIDAAKIGKCDVSVLIEKLIPLGFEFDNFNSNLYNSQNVITEKPFNITDKLDVRPLLEKGQDPFKLIMSKLKDLQLGSTLEIISSFEPIPLIRILEQKNHSCICNENNGIFSLYITKINEELPKNKEEQNNNVFKLTLEEFEDKVKKFEDKESIIKIDVRGLEMPMPMITILDNLEKLSKEKALFVNHFQIPQFLIPELEKRNYILNYFVLDNNEVNLLIVNK